MKRFLITVYVCAIAFTSYSQEKLVSFFDNQDILSISRDFARQNNWFANYPTFREAKFYELIDGNYVLEVFYVKQDSIFKDRTIMSPERKKFYSDSLYATIPATVEINTFSQKGRVPLLIGSTIMSMAFYGAQAATITSNYSHSAKWPFAAYMFTAATGIIVPYYLTKNKEVTLPQASIAFHGQSRGVFHGYAISFAIKNNMNNTSASCIALSTSIAEGFGVYKMAKKLHMTGGQVSTYQLGIDAGIIGGIGLANIAGFTEFNTNLDREKFWGTLVGSSIVFGGAGLLAGRHFNYSIGEAVVLRGSMALGAFLSVPFIHEFEQTHTEPYSTGAIIGGLAGTVVGHYLFNESELTLSEGMYINLGEVTGGLLGLGTAYLIAPESSNQSKITSYLLWGGAIGTLSGYSLMSYFMLNNTPKKSTALQNFNFQFNPMGIYNSKFQQNEFVQHNAMPLAICSLKF